MENTTIKNSGDFEFGEVNYSLLLESEWREDNSITFFINIMDYPKKFQPKVNQAIEEGKNEYIKSVREYPNYNYHNWSKTGVNIEWLVLKVDISFDKTVKTSIYIEIEDKEDEYMETQSPDIPIDLAEFGIDKMSLVEELKQIMFKEIENKFF
ncbi:MAG: hypothetical protein LKJ25_05135 [Clostridia bacterium]|jgi:hypothetical protein|nr:hypothetical protein [Clostridia bacterium]